MSGPIGAEAWRRWRSWRWSAVDSILLAAVVVGALLRAWCFGDLPAGMNQDEAAMAYDAYALFHQGTDRLGTRLPTMLVSWGSGMNPLASYLVAPFVGIFGLSPWSARLPFLLAGVAGIPLFYVLLRDSLDVRTARIGAWLVAISPWHIMMSRWGLESNLFPTVFLVAMVLLLRSTRRPAALVPAAIALAVSLYAYGTSYFVVPVFVAMAGAYGLWHRLWPKRFVFMAAAAFLIIAIPMGLNLAVNSLGVPEIHTPVFTVPRMTGAARYQTMGTAGIFSLEFLKHAVANLDTAYAIFRKQDDGLISNVIPGQGILYWFSPVLALGGLAWLLPLALRRRYEPSFFLFAWSVAAAGLLAFIEINVNRANILWLPFIAWVAIATERLARQRAMSVLLGGAFGASLLVFAVTYFDAYHRMEVPMFYPSFGEAVQYASRQTDGEICVTAEPNQAYIFVLFYNQEDPRTFYRTVRYVDPHADFHTVLSFGRYRFGLDRCRDSAPVLIVPRRETASFPSARFEVAQFERYSVLTRRP